MRVFMWQKNDHWINKQPSAVNGDIRVHVQVCISVHKTSQSKKPVGVPPELAQYLFISEGCLCLTFFPQPFTPGGLILPRMFWYA